MKKVSGLLLLLLVGLLVALPVAAFAGEANNGLLGLDTYATKITDQIQKEEVPETVTASGETLAAFAVDNSTAILRAIWILNVVMIAFIVSTGDITIRKKDGTGFTTRFT